MKNIREEIKIHKAVTTEILIRILNPKIRGWANYYRNSVVSRTFSYIDHMIYKAIDKWIKRRHPNKGRIWTTKNYFRKKRLNSWQFFAKIKGKDGKLENLDLLLANSIHIKRHIKIRGEANPYNPKYKDYFLWLSKIRSTDNRAVYSAL